MCIYNAEWGKSFENSEFGMRNSEFGVWTGKHNELGEEQLAPRRGVHSWMISDAAGALSKKEYVL